VREDVVLDVGAA